MAEFKIIWTKTADIQFVAVLDYWVNRNKSSRYSKKLLSRVLKKVNQIAKNPYSYQAIGYKGIRRATLGNFSIFFKLVENQIYVMAFWDNRQDPKKLFESLKKSKPNRD